MSESAGDVIMSRASGGLLIASGAFLAMLCGSFTGLALASSVHGALEGPVMTSYIDGQTTVTHTPGHLQLGPMIFAGLIGGLPTLLGLTAMAWGARIAFARDGFLALWSRCGWVGRLTLLAASVSPSCFWDREGGVCWRYSYRKGRAAIPFAACHNS